MTQRAEVNALEKDCADDMNTKAVGAVMTKHGFALPAEAVGRTQGGKP